MPIVNDPAVIAEIATLHDAYERALAANDVETLTRFFWDSPDVARYGVIEHLYGAEEIKAYRKSNAVVVTDRKLLQRKIVTFGPGCASVMCEFSQVARGKVGHSRQSQTWIRFPEAGWRIVAAHVSLALPPPAGAWAGYAERAAAALALPLAAGHRPGVEQNLERAAAIVAPLLALTLPADAEVAPVFTP
jgi:hypothetical protein